MTNARSENKTFSAVDEFRRAVEADDFFEQYELLTKATADPKLADAIIDSVSVTGSEQPAPINWREVERQVRRVQRVRSVIAALVSPQAIGPRAWPALLTILAIASAVLSALLIRDGLESSAPNTLVSFGVFFLCLAVLCGTALAAWQGSADAVVRREDKTRGSGDVSKAAAIAIACTTLCTTAVTILAIIVTVVPVPLVRSPGLALLATISPSEHFTIALSPTRAGYLAVKADKNVQLVLRLIDQRGVEIKRATGDGSLRLPLSDQATAQAVRAEITSNETTQVSVSAKGVTWIDATP